MIDKVKQILKNLDRANEQRKKWLIASSVVIIGVIGYIAGWNWIHSLNSQWIDWAFISLGLIISVNWWYWTMGLVRQYIGHQRSVLEILSDIVYDLKEVKGDVKNLNKPVDNNDKKL